MTVIGLRASAKEIRYAIPIIRLLVYEESDVITASVGTENDNNYSDIDWFV